MKKRYFLFDYINFIYFSVIFFLITVFHSRIERYYLYLIFFIIYALFIIKISKLYLEHPENKIILFLRYTYPILFFTFVYRIISGYVTVLYGHFLDIYVLNFQKSLFGTQPVLALEKIVSPYFTEYMKFTYFTYYLYLPGIGFTLFFQKRYKDLIKFLSVITFTFYICYIGFVIFPIEGPRFTLLDTFTIKHLEGFFFTKFQNLIMKYGAVTGACMPSSHVAVAWASLYFIRKFFGKTIFYFIIPFTISLTLAVVYNRYHYFSDAVMGLLFAYIGIKIGNYLYEKYENKQ